MDGGHEAAQKAASPTPPRTVGVEALHVDTGDGNTTALEREKGITLQLMRDHITEHGEDAWRSVAGAGYSMPHNMAGRPREL